MKVELIVDGQPVAEAQLPQQFVDNMHKTTTFIRLHPTLLYPKSLWLSGDETVLVVKLTARDLGVIDCDGQSVPDGDDMNSHLTPPNNT